MIGNNSAVDDALIWSTAGVSFSGNSGGQQLRLNGTTGALLHSDGSAASPGVSFFGDPDTGMYWRAANTLTFAAGGAIAFEATSGGVYAASFNASSSRAIKRETGKPSFARDILARLRPLMYRLLAGDDKEQLGLIAEEVQEVCPQLSDGKSVAYDRLAILLLAAWQDEHLEAA
jgi:hypothetical protein